MERAMDGKGSVGEGKEGEGKGHRGRGKQFRGDLGRRMGRRNGNG